MRCFKRVSVIGPKDDEDRTTGEVNQRSERMEHFPFVFRCFPIKVHVNSFRHF